MMQEGEGSEGGNTGHKKISLADKFDRNLLGGERAVQSFKVKVD